MNEAAENTVTFTVPGEWWWLYTVFELMIEFYGEAKGDLPTTRMLADVYTDKTKATHVGSIELIGHADTTTIVVTAADRKYHKYWNDRILALQRTAARAQKIRRFAAGLTFTTILDDYYSRIERGEKPKLRALAELAGVNYNSLRQAKVRYDQQRQHKSASPDLQK